MLVQYVNLFQYDQLQVGKGTCICKGKLRHVEVAEIVALCTLDNAEMLPFDGVGPSFSELTLPASESSESAGLSLHLSKTI